MLRSLETSSILWLISLFCVSNAIRRGLSDEFQINRREEQAKQLLNYMNLSADPCKDFYDFACGNWAKYHAAVREGDVTTPQSQLEMRVNKDLEIILKEPVTSQDSINGGKIKGFYLDCLAVDTSSPGHHSFLLNFVNRHGGLPSIASTRWQVTYNWVQEIAKLRANYGLEILVGLEIDTNLQTMLGNSIYLTEPKSTLIPVELCSHIATQQVDLREQVYEDLQKEVADNMQTWFNMADADASHFAGDVVRFEFDLCKKMRLEQSVRTGEESENVVAPRNALPYRTGQNRLIGNRLNAQVPRQSLKQWTQQFGGDIDFKQFVDISFGTSINDQVYLRSESYFYHLAAVVKTHSKPTISNYIMYRALSALNFPSEDNRQRRPKYCVELVQRYLPKVLGEMYNRRFHRPDARSDVEQLFSEISKAFDESLGADWLDENTRRAARQKLSQFKARFPVYQNIDLGDLPLERQSNYWHKLELIMKFKARQELNRLHSVDYNFDNIEAYEVDARLMPADSEIVVGWALLKPPFYQPFYPYSLKFSLVGQRLARALITAFDENGWTRNSLSPMRWDEHSLTGFRNRSECFRTQYSNYLHNNPEVFRNASKLRELIADSSGLNVAFKAYLSWLDSKDPLERLVLLKETLPDVNFTNTQLFFINFAQARCAAKYGEQPPPEFLPMDKHTKERYDVNGPLGNFVEFAREFSCTTGTEMSPDDKCVIY